MHPIMNKLGGGYNDSIKQLQMALFSGQLPVTFPGTINANVTNTALPVTVGNTVTVLEAPMATLKEEIYPVTAISAALTASVYSVLVGLKGAQIEYLSANGTDRLYSRTDGIAATSADSQTTALNVITLESVADIQNFRFMGTVSTFIKVVYRG